MKFHTGHRCALIVQPSVLGVLSDAASRSGSNPDRGLPPFLLKLRPEHNPREAHLLEQHLLTQIRQPFPQSPIRFQPLHWLANLRQLGFGFQGERMHRNLPTARRCSYLPPRRPGFTPAATVAEPRCMLDGRGRMIAAETPRIRSIPDFSSWCCSVCAQSSHTNATMSS